MTETTWHPGKILETSGYYWQTCALHAAVNLDLFTIIGDDQATAPEIALAAGTDQDATARLLNALTAMGLLSVKDRAYANTKESAAYLVRSAPGYLGYMIRHHHFLVDAWRQLDQSVQTGQPVKIRSSLSDGSIKEAFLMGMFNNARLMAPRLVKQVDLSDRTRLLDMGGGPGTYAIYFCLQYPELIATVIDLPGSRVFAEKVIREYELDDRIDFRPCDYVTEDLPGTYDAVWMSHILHGENAATCRRMLEKTYQALEPGGLVAIHDFILKNDRTGPLFPALFSLNMLVATPDGRTYTEKEIFEMLDGAGFHDIKRLKYQGPTESGIITASR
ncbi:MAG: methyltransferase [Desulfosudaceae bacterium]